MLSSTRDLFGDLFLAPVAAGLLKLGKQVFDRAMVFLQERDGVLLLLGHVDPPRCALNLCSTSKFLMDGENFERLAGHQFLARIFGEIGAVGMRCVPRIALELMVDPCDKSFSFLTSNGA